MLAAIVFFGHYGNSCLTGDQEQLNTGASHSKKAFPVLCRFPVISYILTFLSQDATARCSDCGENEMSEMLSSGGVVRATSLVKSPRVFAWLVELAVPKRPVMVADCLFVRSLMKASSPFDVQGMR